MSMFRNPTGGIRPVVAISFASVAIVAVTATALAVGSGNAIPPVGPRPSASAVAAPLSGPSAAPIVTPVPTAKPTPVPTAPPTSQPTNTPGPTNNGQDAMPLKVELVTVDGHAVYVDIADQTGLLVSAVSGRPAEGASADGLVVRNVDDRTLHLTWVDFPIDNADALSIEWFDGHIRLLLIQPEPKGDTDAIGFDRELVLIFSKPISAAEVEARITTGLDTPG
jgi:hypothetical protein